MQLRRPRIAIAALLACTALGAAPLAAHADVDISAKSAEVAKSLVIVEYTARNENASREESGQGILVHKDGIILVSGGLIPENLPKEWIKDLKVRVPSSNYASVPATVLGRTRDRLWVYLKADKPLDAPVFDPGDLAPSSLGEEVFATAILGKSGGYTPYIGSSRVRVLLEMTHSTVATASFGLTRSTSPVFDMTTGKMVGLTLPSFGESMFERDSNGSRRVDLVDEDQSSDYLPSSEISYLFKDIPTAPFEQPRAWLGVDEIAGVGEDARALRKIDQPAAVTIGAVVPNEAADKAGIQPQDIVLTVDGKPFSNSPVPEMMVMHFQRVFEHHKPGDTVTLGILRGDKHLDISVTLKTIPKNPGDMPHVFSPKIGITTRDLVFTDAYSRRLPQDTKGVMVALVKNGAPASLGSTPLHTGDLITKVNDDNVEDQKQFLDLMKKIDESPDQKEAVFVVIRPDGNTQVCHVDLSK